MKKCFIVSLMLFFMALPINGCVTMGNGGGWKDDFQKMKSDIYLFSKLATRFILTEEEMPKEDAVIVEEYLVAIRDLLAVPGKPDFSGARQLVLTKLPTKYHIYGLTIIDILENHLNSANLDLTEDQEKIIALIAAGVQGALEAVQEFRL